MSAHGISFWSEVERRERIQPERRAPGDLVDFEGSYETMRKAIEENWWDKRLPAIRAMKQKILNEMNMFPRLENIIRSKGKLSASLA